MYDNKARIPGHLFTNSDEPSLSLAQLEHVMRQAVMQRKAAGLLPSQRQPRPATPEWMERAKTAIAAQELDEIERKMRDRGLR